MPVRIIKTCVHTPLSQLARRWILYQTDSHDSNLVTIKTRTVCRRSRTRILFYDNTLSDYNLQQLQRVGVLQITTRPETHLHERKSKTNNY